PFAGSTRKTRPACPANPELYCGIPTSTRPFTTARAAPNKALSCGPQSVVTSPAESASKIPMYPAVPAPHPVTPGTFDVGAPATPLDGVAAIVSPNWPLAVGAVRSHRNASVSQSYAETIPDGALNTSGAPTSRVEPVAARATPKSFVGTKFPLRLLN